MADGDITVPAAWFYTIWCLLIGLIILVVFLWIMLQKMKSRVYEKLHEPNESIVTTINSNKFNIQLQDRKQSDQMLRMCTNFSFDESDAPSKDNSSVENKTPTSSEMVPKNDTKEVKYKPTLVAQPHVLLRQQMEQICNELLTSINKKKSANNADNAEESYELRNVSIERDHKKSLRASSRIKSKSTTDLALYDVIPGHRKTFNYKVPAKEDEKYSIPRNAQVVIVEDESGYLLPITGKIAYVNANN